MTSILESKTDFLSLSVDEEHTPRPQVLHDLISNNMITYAKLYITVKP